MADHSTEKINSDPKKAAEDRSVWRTLRKDCQQMTEKGERDRMHDIIN